MAYKIFPYKATVATDIFRDELLKYPDEIMPHLDASYLRVLRWQENLTGLSTIWLIFWESWKEGGNDIVKFKTT